MMVTNDVGGMYRMAKLTKKQLEAIHAKGHKDGCGCVVCSAMRRKAQNDAKAGKPAKATKKTAAKKAAPKKKAPAKKKAKAKPKSTMVRIGYRRDLNAASQFTEVEGSKNALRVLQSAAEDRGIETMHCWREVKPNGVTMVETLDQADIEDKTIAEASATGTVFVGPYSKFG